MDSISFSTQNLRRNFSNWLLSNKRVNSVWDSEWQNTFGKCSNMILALLCFSLPPVLRCISTDMSLAASQWNPKTLVFNHTWDLQIAVMMKKHVRTDSHTTNVWRALLMPLSMDPHTICQSWGWTIQVELQLVYTPFLLLQSRVADRFLLCQYTLKCWYAPPLSQGLYIFFTQLPLSSLQRHGFTVKGKTKISFISILKYITRLL